MHNDNGLNAYTLLVCCSTDKKSLPVITSHCIPQDDLKLFVWEVQKRSYIIIIQFSEHIRATDCSMRYLHAFRWPQVAAACSGVQSSVSETLTLAPNWIRSLITSSRLSMLHCKDTNDPITTNTKESTGFNAEEPIIGLVAPGAIPHSHSLLHYNIVQQLHAPQQTFTIATNCIASSAVCTELNEFTRSFFQRPCEVLSYG